MRAPAKVIWIQDRIAWKLFSFRQKRQDQINLKFDAAHGTDTAAEVHLTAVGVSADEASRGNAVYRSLWEDQFHAAMTAMARQTSVPFEKFTFVDIGSGKGKLLLLASLYRFRRIVGIEYAPGLHAVATRNIVRFKHEAQQCSDLQSNLGDALTFTLPTGPVIALIFNAFDPATTKRVLDNLVRQRSDGADATFVIYENVRRTSEIGTTLNVVPPWRKLERTRRRIVVGNEEAARLWA